MKSCMNGMLLFLFILIWAFGTCASALDRIVEPKGNRPIIVDFFYEPGCPECESISTQILPELERQFSGQYVLISHDIGIETNLLYLLKLEDSLGLMDNIRTYIIIDRRYAFNRIEGMGDALSEKMAELVAQRESVSSKEHAVQQPEIPNGDLFNRRMACFTVPAVLAAGLIDGINPCAISTLVFFMSLLALARVKGRALLLMGVSFCLASFATYTALGFGLLRALHLFGGLAVLRLVVEIVMIAVLGIFAYLSFHDAYRYNVSGDPNQVTLQLPHSIKRRIHKIMRTGLSVCSLVPGCLLIGAAVTALESVCTGQVYVPTLVMVIKSGKSASSAWFYLLLYNTMFIVPLAIVFILTHLGLRTETLLNWSRENVVISKILLGCFFLAMAVLIGLV